MVGHWGETHICVYMYMDVFVFVNSYVQLNVLTQIDR